MPTSFHSENRSLVQAKIDNRFRVEDGGEDNLTIFPIVNNFLPQRLASDDLCSHMCRTITVDVSLIMPASRLDLHCSGVTHGV